MSRIGRRTAVSYQLSPDAEFQLLELILYVFGFVALLLIFLYIAYERPAETTKKKPVEEE